MIEPGTRVDEWLKRVHESIEASQAIREPSLKLRTYSGELRQSLKEIRQRTETIIAEIKRKTHRKYRRSNPDSANYQAWIGVYTMRGGSAIFANKTEIDQFHQLAKVAELDQEAWLAGMGDPEPKAHWRTESTAATMKIGGEVRPLYAADRDIIAT